MADTMSAATSWLSCGWHSLPTELRLEVYRQCWEPRKIQFRCRRGDDKAQALSRKLPITLAINHEAREETLRHYKRWSLLYNDYNPARRVPGYLSVFPVRGVMHGYINPKIDSIEIHDEHPYKRRWIFLTGLVLGPTISASLDVTVTAYTRAVRAVVDAVSIFDTPANRRAVRRIRVIVSTIQKTPPERTNEFAIDLAANSLKDDMIAKSTPRS